MKTNLIALTAALAMIGFAAQANETGPVEPKNPSHEQHQCDAALKDGNISCETTASTAKRTYPVNALDGLNLTSF